MLIIAVTVALVALGAAGRGAWAAEADGSVQASFVREDVAASGHGHGHGHGHGRGGRGKPQASFALLVTDYATLEPVLSAVSMRGKPVHVVARLAAGKECSQYEKVFRSGRIDLDCVSVDVEFVAFQSLLRTVATATETEREGESERLSQAYALLAGAGDGFYHTAAFEGLVAGREGGAVAEAVDSPAAREAFARHVLSMRAAHAAAKHSRYVVELGEGHVFHPRLVQRLLAQLESGASAVSVMGAVRDQPLYAVARESADGANGANAGKWSKRTQYNVFLRKDAESAAAVPLEEVHGGDAAAYLAAEPVVAVGVRSSLLRKGAGELMSARPARPALSAGVSRVGLTEVVVRLGAEAPVGVIAMGGGADLDAFREGVSSLPVLAAQENVADALLEEDGEHAPEWVNVPARQLETMQLRHAQRERSAARKAEQQQKATRQAGRPKQLLSLLEGRASASASGNGNGNGNENENRKRAVEQEGYVVEPEPFNFQASLDDLFPTSLNDPDTPFSFFTTNLDTDLETRGAFAGRRRNSNNLFAPRQATEEFVPSSAQTPLDSFVDDGTASLACVDGSTPVTPVCLYNQASTEVIFEGEATITTGCRPAGFSCGRVFGRFDCFCQEDLDPSNGCNANFISRRSRCAITEEVSATVTVNDFVSVCQVPAAVTRCAYPDESIEENCSDLGSSVARVACELFKSFVDIDDNDDLGPYATPPGEEGFVLVRTQTEGETTPDVGVEFTFEPPAGTDPTLFPITCDLVAQAAVALDNILGCSDNHRMTVNFFIVRDDETCFHSDAALVDRLVSLGGDTPHNSEPHTLYSGKVELNVGDKIQMIVNAPDDQDNFSICNAAALKMELSCTA